MASQLLTPDTVVSVANLAGNTSASAFGTPGTWATATSTNNTATEARVGFPTPTLALTPGAGLQTIRVDTRKSTSNSGNPTGTIELWETGGAAPLASSAPFSITTTGAAGQSNYLTFDASILSQISGASVEARIACTGVGGSPSSRNAADIGYIAWTATTTEPDTTPPTITSPSSANVQENSAFSQTLTADESVTWSKTGGADAALFTLSGSTLSMAAKDFENPLDADGNNYYEVQVTATDAEGNATAQTILVTVTDAPIPTITSSTTVSVAENATLAHALITATGSPTWAIVGGADSAQFSLSGNILRWVGNGTQNFESPADADQDNVYTVIVRANLAGETDDQTINVTVTDVEEVPPPTISGEFPSAVIGQPYSFIPTLEGGTPPYTFSLASGSLPPGLTLDPATGEVSGTPTDAPVIDETPDQFTFNDQVVPPGTSVQSNTITVSGLGSGVSVPVGIVEVEPSDAGFLPGVSKNGGGFDFPFNMTAQNGDTFALRHTSHSFEQSRVTTRLTVGNTSDDWTTTSSGLEGPGDVG